MQNNESFSDIQMFVRKSNTEISEEYFRHIESFSDKELTNLQRKRAVRYFQIFLYRNKLLLRYIETCDLDKYVIFLKKGEYKNSQDKVIGPASLHLLLALLQSFFLWCYERKHVDNHPDRIFTKGFKRRLPKIDRKSPEYHSFKEIQKLLDTAANNKKALLFLLYNSMGRIEAVVNAKISNFDYNRKVLVYRESKNSVELEVILSDATANHLQEYLLKFRPNDDSDYIFISRLGTRMSSYAVRYYLKKHSLKVLKKKLTPKSFRSAGITHMIEAGADISEVQTIVGHANIQTTARYKAYNPRYRHDIMVNAHPLLQLENARIKEKKIRDTISRTKKEFDQTQKTLQKIIETAQKEFDDWLEK